MFSKVFNKKIVLILVVIVLLGISVFLFKDKNFLSKKNPKEVVLKQLIDDEFIAHIDWENGVIYAVGDGVFRTDTASMEIKKQESLVAAFIEGVAKLAEMSHEVSIPEKVKKNSYEKIVVQLEQTTVGDFKVSFRDEVENYKNIKRRVNAMYKNQNIVIKNFELASPSVDKLDFPSWKNLPEIIGGIKIEKIKWYKDGSCSIMISYPMK